MYIKDTSGNRVGDLRGDEVFTPSGSRVGQFRGDDFYTASGSRIGQLRGSDVYTASGSRIGQLRGNEIYSASGGRVGWVDGSPSTIQLGAAAVALLSGLLEHDSDSSETPPPKGAGGDSEEHYDHDNGDDDERCGGSTDDYVKISTAIREDQNSARLRHLIEVEGINVNIRGAAGLTPLMLYFFYSQPSSEIVETVRFLIMKGADVNAERIPSGFAVLKEPGSTPLLLALDGYLRKNSCLLEVVKLLVNNGANVNAKRRNNMTPLHYAAGKGPEIKVLEYLISQGADVNAEDDYGRRPLNDADGEEKKRVLREAGGTENPNAKKRSACYIATAVYGSYDAPEVLCLRRFRDEVLSTSYLGRLFIALYYRFSPAIAERLKRTTRINIVVRKILNKIVTML